MKSVVMIAHGFPPEGNAGVYRPLRFVRHLPDMGWRPAIVACDKRVYERYDPGLLALIPPDTVIRRVRGYDPWETLQAWRRDRIEHKSPRYSGAVGERLQGASGTRVRACLREMARHAESWCYHPDAAMGWIRPAVKEAGNLCAAAGQAVIYATAGPLSAFVVAQRVSHLTGAPYVLDFRDAWTITHNDFEARRPAWATRRDRLMVRQTLREARAVVFRYQAEAECFWRAYAGAFHPSKVHIIPNGYDGAVSDAPIPGGDRCTILYTGTLSSYRADTLLEGLRTFKQRDPDGARRLSLVVVGEGADALREEAASCGVGDLVEARGPVSHAETTELHQRAHALLVLGRPSAMKGYELFAGAKVFEYLKAGRPIVGLLPADETRNVLSRVKVSTIADIRSPAEIIVVLKTLIDAWTTGGLRALLPDRAACEAYSAERQTAALVRALEGAPAVEPFIPGAVEVPPSLRADIERGDWMRHRRSVYSGLIRTAQ